MGGSSAHRRPTPNHRPKPRTGRRTAFRPAAATPASETHMDYAAHALTPANPGFALLVKMGHVPGTPLGAAAPPGSPATPARATEPLPIVVRGGRAGVGAAVARSAPLCGGFGSAVSGDDGGMGGSAAAADALSFTRDPLRPRCRFNDAHVVKDLRALQSHEARCPDREVVAPVPLMASLDDEDEANLLGDGDGSDGMMSEVSEDEADVLAGRVRIGLGLGS